jgi:UDP-N-acetylmuramoyl-tripeptide--D-alanyl-D-alanine ligase
MSATLNDLIDVLERRIKPVVKSLYQKPLINTAAVWRRVLSRTCFIGITGSAGKTTTKELVHSALASSYRCSKSHDSNNQLYDVARSLLSSMPWTQFCVQETGASAPGKFAPMMALLKPQVGVVTNIGTDHVRAFRTRDAVFEEKLNLITSLPADGLAVLNADDPIVMTMAAHSRARIVTYGLHNEAEFRGETVTDRWPSRLALRVHHGSETILIQTQLLPPYQASNVLAAVATACSLGVPLDQAARAISLHQPMLGRMSLHMTGRGTAIVRDDWKAPYWSLFKAVQYVADAPAARKVIVLGTISDGGNMRGLYRKPVAAALAAADYVLLVGPRAAAAAPRLAELGGERLLIFEFVRDAARWLSDFARKDDLVLLKGSGTADHLARMALALDHEVLCWRVHCPRKVLCDRCRLSGAPTVP